VPNLARVVSNFFGTQTPDLKAMPPLPAIFGLDPTGVIAKVGDQVRAVRPGNRVYVNPARSCGSCRMCRSGQVLDCPNFTFQGYFGRSQDIMRAYPYGGFAQFITAPATALVKLPDNVSFEAAARLGYFGTAYAAMKKLDVGPGHSLLINGISGTLGLCAALLALAMGATKILGTGRNAALLERVKALAPARIDVFAMADAPSAGQPDPFVAWAKDKTDGYGVDGMIDCLPPGAPARRWRRWPAPARSTSPCSSTRCRRSPRSTRRSPAWPTATAASPISSSTRRGSTSEQLAFYLALLAQCGEERTERVRDLRLPGQHADGGRRAGELDRQNDQLP
jgi:threonine dehydrogenase-like Zn-dependent dehydrogenase